MGITVPILGKPGSKLQEAVEAATMTRPMRNNPKAKAIKKKAKKTWKPGKKRIDRITKKPLPVTKHSRVNQEDKPSFETLKGERKYITGVSGTDKDLKPFQTKKQKIKQQKREIEALKTGGAAQEAVLRKNIIEIQQGQGGGFNLPDLGGIFNKKTLLYGALAVGGFVLLNTMLKRK